MRLIKGILTLFVAVGVAGCGDDAGTQMDGGGADLTTSMPAAEQLRVTSFALKYAQSGTPFGYRAALSKPGQAAWSLKSAPTGAAIDAAAGTISWTPTDGQGGANDFVVHADLNGESAEQSFRVQVAVIKIEASQAIDPANPNGGTVTVDAPLSPVRGSAIQVQPGALPPGSPVTLTISSVQNLPAPPLAQVAGLAAGDLLPIEFGPSGTAFSKPVNLTLPAPAAVLAKGNPTVQTFDYATNRWTSVPVVSVDSAGGVVVAQAPHFTPFVLAPGVQLYNLSLGLGGAQCSGSLLVKAPLALTFAQLPASTVNGYGGMGSSVADVLAGLQPGQALQLYTTLHAQTGDKTASRDGWLLASAIRQMDGSFQVGLSSDAHAPLGANVPPMVMPQDVEAWLNGSRVDALFGGLGMGLSSGASVSAELSLYLVAAPDAQKLPAQVANAVGKDTAAAVSLAAIDGFDSDCDQASDAFDATPTGAPPPSLAGTPANVGVAVGTPVTLTVTTSGAPALAWSASDPSVTLQPSADGLSAVATPTLVGQFHVDVVGTTAAGTGRFSFNLNANPQQMVMPPPPFVALAASSSTVRAGGKVSINAFGKSPLPMTFRWTAPASVLSATSGDAVEFSAANPGDYTVSVIGNDGTQDSPPALVTISVLAANANQPPPSPLVTPMSALLQHGAGQGVMAVLSAHADDPDGDALTYDFQADPQNPSGFMLVKSGTSATFFSGTDGVYVFYVTATDSHGATSPWTAVKLQVAPTLPPQPVDNDHDGYPSGIDCNDNDPAIHPGAKEICADSIDQDCNGSDIAAADCDADGDRFSTNQGDCNDNDPARNPGAVERCDAVDNNCNGQTDEGFAVGQACTAGVGACAAAGTNQCNAAQNGVACNAVAGLPHAETCNGADDDCNGKVDDVSATAGGDVNNCGGCNVVCSAPANESAACTNGGCSYACAAGFVDTDKNPANGCECQITNGGVETCDGMDNDCNGLTDDNTAQVFYDGPNGTLGVGVCASGVRSCVNGSLVVTRAEKLPAAEACNGIDDNCDGHVDETFAFGMDAQNCGHCGNVCASGFCQAGSCQAAPVDMAGVPDLGSGGCGSGQVLCASGCSSLVSDNNNCGSCDNKCGTGFTCMLSACMPNGGSADMGTGGPVDLATPPSDMGTGGGASDMGTGISCPAPFTACGPDCVYMPNDPGHCGACGTVCSGTQTCQNGSCVAAGSFTYGAHCTQNTDCAAGMVCFNQASFGFPSGFCAPICDSSRPCAGATACSPYQAGTAGACLPQCAGNGDCTAYAGFLCTNNMCQPDCRNAGSTNYCHAGQICSATGQCVSGGPVDMAAPSCFNGWSTCGTGCEYASDDPRNCGGCGTTCAGVCSSGACATAGANAFGATCGNNNDCQAGLFCIDQVRFNWPGGFCSAFCDPSHPCGAGRVCTPQNGSGGSGVCLQQCGMDMECRAGYICQAGSCQPGCASNPSQCSGGTVCDPVSNHCKPGTVTDAGTCVFQCSNAACGAPDGCGGSCQPGSGCVSCPAGFTLCDGECVEFSDDPLHCGACHPVTSCTAAQVCMASSCAPGGSGAFGTTCTKNNDCSGGGTCIDEARYHWTGGFCSQFCDPMHPCAGGTEMCQPLAPGQQNGVCVQKCGADVDCRSGYLCGAGYCQPDCRTNAAYCTNGQMCDGATGHCTLGGPVDMGTGGGCSAPMMMCPGGCIDPRFDVNNCGSCNFKCGGGQVCNNSICVSGGPTDLGAPPDLASPCGPGQSFCGGTCIATASDPMNCGGCGVMCGGGGTCLNSQCLPPGAVCSPGQQRACYTGPALTNGVGACHGGQQNCMGNGQWDIMCPGQVTPQPTDSCGNGSDDDCDGIVDNGCPLAAVTQPFTIVVNDSIQMIASGGTGSYNWSVLTGVGSLVGNTYNAGATPGPASLQVNDGNTTATTSANVVSLPPVSLTPPGGLLNGNMAFVTLQTAVHTVVTSAAWGGQSLPPVTLNANGTGQMFLPKLPDGTYTLTVNVSGPGGVTNSGSAMYTFDTTPPAPPTITSPAPGGSAAGPAVVVTGTTEPNANVTLNDSVSGPAGNAQADAAGNWQITTPSLVVGQHTLTAFARDVANNGSQASAAVTFSVTSGTAGPLQPSPSNGQLAVNASMTFTASGGTPPYVWAPVNMTTGGMITQSGQYTAGPTAGTDTVSVTDSAGMPASVQVMITVLAPLAVNITSPMNNATIPAGQQIQLQGSTAPMAMLQVLVDGKPSGSGGTDPMGNFNLPVMSNLATGPHVIEVDAQKGAQSGSATINITIAAATGPQVQLTSPINGATGVTNPVTLTGTADPGVNLQVFLDNPATPIANITVGPMGSWSVPVMQSLAAGSPHNWGAKATNPMTMAQTSTQVFNFTMQ